MVILIQRLVTSLVSKLPAVSVLVSSLLCISPCLSASPDLNGSAPVCEFKEQPTGRNITRCFAFQEQLDQTSSQQQAQVPSWTPLTRSRVYRGIGRHVVKYQSEFVNHSGQALNLVVELETPHLDEVSASYLIDSSNTHKEFTFGDAYPFAQRPIITQYFAFPVVLDPGERARVQFTVNSAGSMDFPIRAWGDEAFNVYDQRRTILSGIYGGLVFAFVLAFITLFVAVHRIYYLYYAGIISSLLMLMMSLSGLGFQFFWPSYPDVNQYFIPVTMASLHIFLALLFINVGNSGHQYPEIRPYVNGYVFSLLALCGLSPFLSYEISIQIVLIFAAIGCLLILATSGYLLWSGNKNVQPFFIAWSIVTVTAIANVSDASGWLYLPVSILTLCVSATLMMMTYILFYISRRFGTTYAERKIAEEKLEQSKRVAQQEQERYLEFRLAAREEEMEARQRIIQAETENKAKSEFLAIMSHEIRTPMNGVLGIAELLQGTKLDKQQKEYLNIIQNSGQSLLNIINDILDLSKISAGKMSLDSIDFSIDELCTEATSVFANVAEQKTIELMVIIEQALPLCIHGDSVRIRQVILNLCSNAVKFTENGKVILRVAKINPQRAGESAFIRFEVQDTGIGISPESQLNLFEAFTQGDKSTTRQYGGTGLGLSICKQLVNLMGGDIGVESEKGKGSCFWFTIPFVQASADFVSSNQRDTGSIADKRILFIGTSQELPHIYRDHCLGWGINADFALSIEESIEVLSRARDEGTAFDFVMVDCAAENDPHLLGPLLEQWHDLSPSSCFLLCASPHHMLDTSQLETFGVDKPLLKPVTAYRLLDALIETTGQDIQGASAATVQQSDSNASGGKILVVEDNHVNQMVITGMLKRLGYDLHLVDNGKLALDKYCELSECYDCILMDCEMPVMDGYEASARIRMHERENALPAVPIVALTAHAMAEYQTRFAEAGMNDHIPKPVNIMRLRERLQHWVSLRQENVAQHGAEDSDITLATPNS
ncbi:hypothetical protein NBRC116495_16540 [Aurantivibrio plasticivorans]